MKINICTVTARTGFLDMQARMIAAQDYKDISWVVVDFAFEARAKMLADLSKELGLEIIHLPNVRDDKLRFMRDITRNRNRALQHADGDAVIFLDDYACIPPEFVSRHLPTLKDNCLSAGNMFRFVRDRVPPGKLNPSCWARYFLALSESEGLNKDYRDRNGTRYKSTGISYTGNLGIPRVIFETLNGFDPRLDGALEDCDLGMRAWLCQFECFFNPDAYTINMDGLNTPYVFSFDHPHDLEPFISNPNNNYFGDATLKENEFMTVQFFEGYRVATCKLCGCRALIDGNELIAWKQRHNEFAVPQGLPGGYK